MDVEKDYNTQREKLIMPEYGRSVQKMIEYVKQIPDRTKRNEEIRAVVQVMSIINPQTKDSADYRHKLWDHVQVIAGFDLDIDSPYPKPDKDKYRMSPEPVPMRSGAIKEACYGRNIQNMIEVIAAKEEGDMKKELIRTLGIYMRQQYLIWNKDSVSEETIFADMERLSGGKLKVPADVRLGELRGDSSQYMRPGIGNMGQSNNNRKDYKKNRKWKRN